MDHVAPLIGACTNLIDIGVNDKADGRRKRFPRPHNRPSIVSRKADLRMCDKSKLRLELIGLRAEAFAACASADSQLVKHFPSTINITGHIIAAYMPFRTEIDPLPLLRALVARGGQGVMPRIGEEAVGHEVGIGVFSQNLYAKGKAPPPRAGLAHTPSLGWGVLPLPQNTANTAHFPVTPHPPTPSPLRGIWGGRGAVLPLNTNRSENGEGLLHRARRLRAEPTVYEKKLWDLLRAKRPDGTHWRRQVGIGGFVYDFGCHGLKLLIEVDGEVYRLPEVQARDTRKTQMAAEHGYRLIRLQNADVLKIETAQYFDQYAKPEAPPPLWGGVGVGGLSEDGVLLETSAIGGAPPSPDPFPTKGGRGEALTFHLCDIGDKTHFIPNKWGLLEPRADLPQATPTILLVPLLGFDRGGHRLGYGKGFYDEAIARLRSEGPLTTIGLAFAQQEVEQIPTQPHDQRLDWIITENEAYRCPS